MSDPAAALPPTSGDDVAAELTARRASAALEWTKPENWDGDDYTGPGLPPWGTKPRCPVARNGRRCRKSVIPGGAVCNTHGGSAPQVKRRAQLRLLSLVDPALGALARTLATTTDDALRTKIAFGILDRTGLGKAQDVSAEVAKALLIERHAILRAQLLEQAAAQAGELGTLEAEYEDAEIVTVPEEGVQPVSDPAPAPEPEPEEPRAPILSPAGNPMPEGWQPKPQTPAPPPGAALRAPRAVPREDHPQ